MIMTVLDFQDSTVDSSKFIEIKQNIIILFDPTKKNYFKKVLNE